jgi:hypothetical protein
MRGEKMKKKIAVVIVLLVLPSITFAGKPEKPGGGKVDLEAALATETQERKDADADAGLQGQIDDINTGTTGGLKLFDANNQFLGILINYETHGTDWIDDQYDYFTATVYNPTFDGIVYWRQYYISSNPTVIIDLPEGELFYLTDNCTEPSYIGATNWLTSFTKNLGYIPAIDKYFFASGPRLTLNANEDIKSRLLIDGSCSPGPGGGPGDTLHVYEYSLVEAPFNFPAATPLKIDQ